MTGINGITYFLSTIPPWYIVDSWGRRLILLSGAVAMCISLSLISYFIFLDISYTPRLVVIFVMIYNAAFGYSWGPIPWLYPPEILPLSIRSKGASLSTATNWACNWLVGELTPVLQEWIQWRLYLVHAFFCAASFVIGKLNHTGDIQAQVLTFASLLHLPRDIGRPARRHELHLRRRNNDHRYPRINGHARTRPQRRPARPRSFARALARHSWPSVVGATEQLPRPRYRPSQR